MNKKMSQTIYAYILLSPVLILFLVFYFFPAVFSGVLSFSKYNLITRQLSFTGIENFVQVLQDPIQPKVFFNTIIYMISMVVGSIGLGLGLAVLVNSAGGVIKNVSRTLLLLPSITSIAVMGIVWKIILCPTNEGLNSILAHFGIEPVSWLLDPKWAMASIVTVGIWHMLGYAVVIFTAALMDINFELYEAVDIDGGGRLHKFIHVTVPQISPILFFMTITSIINSFKSFESVSVMTKGGPDNVTNVIGYKIWQEGFLFFNSGNANALSMILFLFLFIVIVLFVKYFESRVSYES